MKKLWFIPVLLLAAVSVTAQDLFKVPEISDAAKYANMVGQANAFIANSINYAKSQGKTVEDIARFTGEQFKTSWNKEAGYNGFVKGMLYISTCFFPKAEIGILDQTETSITYKVISDPEFLRIFPLFNVSFDEYLVFWKGVIAIVGEYLGAEYMQEFKDNIIYVTIKKK
jgi:hypothetical protein